MDCLSPERIMLFHAKAIQRFGGGEGILHPGNIRTLQDYVVEVAAPNFGFDDIETACLATYQIAKGHFFMDGNKRTANYILLNCIKSLGYTYTGRPIDLARKIEELSQSPSDKKESTVRELSYYLKARLQKIDN